MTTSAHKHSFSVPSTPASNLYSPASPLLTRSSKPPRTATATAPPVTPQRLPRQHLQFSSPITPITPYTPLSLRSFASSNSNGSSTLTTPNSVNVNRLDYSSTPMSPEVAKSASCTIKDKSLADIAENWRSRASENGIKVSSGKSVCEDSHYGDDEASDRTLSDVNDSGFITTEEALLPPPFLSTHRRPRAQSHAVPPARTSHLRNSSTSNARPLLQPTSPNILRTPARSSRLNSSLTMNTPPPNRALAQQLKMKGSFTDPAHTRRRPTFGLGPSTPARSGDLSSQDLFDIDENDFENEYELDQEYDNEYEYAPYLQYTQNFSSSTPYPNAYEHSFPTYTQFSASAPSLYGQPLLNDPFNGGPVLSSISESVEHHFHEMHKQQAQDENQNLVQGYARRQDEYHATQNQGHGQNQNQNRNATYAQVAYQSQPSLPSLPPVPKLNLNPIMTSAAAAPAPTLHPTSCSVCARPTRSLAILSPCTHPLCSACLTSALNIVGEKDMECAVCKQGVEDFRLVVVEPAAISTPVPASPGSTRSTSSVGKDGKEKKEKRVLGAIDMNREQTSKSKGRGKGKEEDMSGKSFMDPLFSSPGSVGSSGEALRSAFELGMGFDGVRASTPKSDKAKEVEGKVGGRKNECVVLRIDNVPWDITPPSISAWLQQPVERVHVLLDRKGKTMSHAFVEVATEEIARAVLRGEAGKGGMGKGGDREKTVGGRGRGSVLGKGRRARGVTVTRSGQEELMRALFPAWRGNFDSSRPSLAGLDNEHVISTLESGLMTEGEIAALLHLIRSPDSHFLKVPSLPFHSLISILSKFPADVDSRVFWSGTLRDLLYDVTFAAIQVLFSRIDQNKPIDEANRVVDGEVDMELLYQLIRSAMSCQAFTTQQISTFSDLLDSHHGSPSPSSSYASPSAPPSSASENSPRTPDQPHPTPNSHQSHSQIHAQTRTQTPPSSQAQVRQPEAQADPNNDPREGAFGALAREFGVEAQLVQALAQRLSGMC